MNETLRQPSDHEKAQEAHNRLLTLGDLTVRFAGVERAPRYPAYIAHLLERYEHQIEPEARFARFVDKILPAIIYIMAGDANTFKEDHKMANAAAVLENREAHTAKLQAMFPEFQFIHIVRDLISNTSIKHMFPNES